MTYDYQKRSRQEDKCESLPPMIAKAYKKPCTDVAYISVALYNSAASNSAASNSKNHSPFSQNKLQSPFSHNKLQ